MAASETITLSEAADRFRRFLLVFFPWSSSPSLRRYEEDDVARSKREFCTSMFRNTSSSTSSSLNSLLVVEEVSIQSSEVFRKLLQPSLSVGFLGSLSLLTCMVGANILLVGRTLQIILSEGMELEDSRASEM